MTSKGHTIQSDHYKPKRRKGTRKETIIYIELILKKFYNRLVNGFLVANVKIVSIIIYVIIFFCF